MLNLNCYFEDTVILIEELDDFDLLAVIAYLEDLPEYKVYTIASNIVGIIDQKTIDKSFEAFYFSKNGGLLNPNIRHELRRAYEIHKR